MFKNKAFFLAVASTLHLLVDCICLLSLYLMIKTGIYDSSFILYMFVLYNFLAFATQPFFGLLADKFRKEKEMAIIGSLLVIMGSFLATYSPVMGVIIFGVGNAIFHIGGGSWVLQSFPKSFFPIGVFVAPGAIGLTLGILSSRWDFDFRIITAILIIIAILLIYLIPPLQRSVDQIRPLLQKSFSKSNIAIISLLFVAIFIRALTGSVLNFSWKTDISLLLLLTLAVALGKGFGGLLAEKFGWLKVSSFGLILSGILFGFFIETPLAGIIGSFVFNFTMPITLFLAYRTLRNRPGLAFGITCLALYFGSLIIYSSYKNSLSSDVGIIVSIVIGIIALLIVNKLYLNQS